MILPARLPFALLCFGTATYCFIAHVPVLYEQMIRNVLFPWIPTVVTLHPYLFLLSLVPVGLTSGKGRGAFLVVNGLFGIGLALFPLLPRLRSDYASLAWTLLWFLPPIWLAALDVGAVKDRNEWDGPLGDRGPFFSAAVLSALFVTGVYFAIGSLRGGRGDPRLLLWSLASHLVLFLGAAFVLAGTRRVAGLFSRPRWVELWLFVALAVLFVGHGIREEVLRAFSYASPWGIAVSRLGGLSLVLCVVGIRLRLPGRFPLWLLPLLAAAAYGFTAAILLVDWNFLMQRLSAFTVWVITFLVFLDGPGLRLGRRAAEAACVAALIGFLALTPADYESRYLGRDPSLQVALSLLRPPVADGDFYDRLREGTRFLPEALPPPPEVRLVRELGRPSRRPPHLFVILVDSLRRDYVGAFNPAAPFTPRIDEWARRSVAFRNAFTRYGATGLSEPSLWVGGLIPHKYYLSPFRPLNSLQKLVEHEGYRSFVSVDSILRVILDPWPKLAELDEGVPTQRLDLCRTVEELRGHLGRGREEPLFVYTQAQNLHISLPKRQVASEVPGFDGPYAGALREVDRCFGRLIDALEEEEILDDSILVLASDHGDSLGEEGRYGHTYNLFPEILRIPLIVHLPAKLRAGLKWDAGTLAFLTDVTPSLYQVLGHGPVESGELFGRSLFGREPPRDRHLVLSSYGAVYGMLFEGGASLYIADAVNRRDYLFRGERAASLSENERSLYRKWIESDLATLHRFYGTGRR